MSDSLATCTCGGNDRLSGSTPQLWLLVCGSRHFSDPDAIYAAMLEAIWHWGSDEDNVLQVIHGGARGVDMMAGRIAKQYLQAGVKVFRADWNRYGLSAGPRRNQEMADYLAGICVVHGKVLAIPLADSTGTYDMVRRAKEKGLDTYIWMKAARGEAE